LLNANTKNANNRADRKGARLAQNFVRQTISDGRIIHVKAGKKLLINAQKVEEWLNAGDSPATVPTPSQVQAATKRIT